MMRTVRTDRRGEGGGGVYLPRGCPCTDGVPAQGVYLTRRMYLPGGVYLPRGMYLPGGCTCPGWCTCLGAVPARGCNCLGRGCIPACTEAHPLLGLLSIHKSRGLRYIVSELFYARREGRRPSGACK